MGKAKKLVALFLMLAMMFALVACSQEAPAEESQEAPTSEAAPQPEAKEKENWTIAVVTKDNAAPWFIRMETGINEYKEKTGLNVVQKGPATADAASQVQVVEDMIAQGVDALCVVPTDPAALESTLKSAMDQGIVVVTHEGPSQENTMYNIEAFSSENYGKALMDALAEAMGGKGVYTTMVGYTTTASHMEWVEAAVAYQKEAYPDMVLLNDANPGAESEENTDTAYERAKELFKANPDLAGMLSTAGTAAPGVAMALEELGIADRVAYVAVGTPNELRDYIKSGTINTIALWDPAAAGYAMCTLATIILEGNTVENGVNLGYAGWDNMQFVGDSTKLMVGDGSLLITAENVDDYDF